MYVCMYVCMCIYGCMRALSYYYYIIIILVYCYIALWLLSPKGIVTHQHHLTYKTWVASEHIYHMDTLQESGLAPFGSFGTSHHATHAHTPHAPLHLHRDEYLTPMQTPPTQVWTTTPTEWVIPEHWQRWHPVRAWRALAGWAWTGCLICRFYCGFSSSTINSSSSMSSRSGPAKSASDIYMHVHLYV